MIQSFRNGLPKAVVLAPLVIPGHTRHILGDQAAAVLVQREDQQHNLCSPENPVHMVLVIQAVLIVRLLIFTSPAAVEGLVPLVPMDPVAATVA
jgi:hypothetical protein